jgi:chaperonin GroES
VEKKMRLFERSLGTSALDERIAGMRIVPLGDKVVVRRIEAEEKTAGGIMLPDTARERPHEGKVLSIGDGRLLESGSRGRMQVREGDRVIFSNYSGNEVNVDGELLLVMSEDDILAVIE